MNQAAVGFRVHSGWKSWETGPAFAVTQAQYPWTIFRLTRTYQDSFGRACIKSRRNCSMLALLPCFRS